MTSTPTPAPARPVTDRARAERAVRPDRVLTVDRGATGLKARLLEPSPDPCGWRVVASWDRSADRVTSSWLSAVTAGVDDGRLAAVAHRVVLGGGEAAALVDRHVHGRLHAASTLSPDASGPALAALTACERATDVPQVACCDVAFHATLPAEASTYAVPREWARQMGVRRVGAHGLAHRWADRRGRALAGGRARRVVTAHLGATSSLAAVRDGVCLDASQGFTTVEGLVGGTGSGTVDAGLVLHVQERLGWSPARMREALERESGLAGISGGRSDVRALLAAERAGDRWAALALRVYLHRLRASVAAMAASLGGLDLLVFTGGVGEACAQIRQRACEGLAFLGIAPLAGAVEAHADEHLDGDRVVGAGGTASVAVVRAREDVEMATLARTLLAHRPAARPAKV